jgi:hypothetical protein
VRNFCSFSFPPSPHDDSSLAAAEILAMLHSWQSRLAESAALEAAVVAEMTAAGLPSFPVHANSVGGSTLLSQNSFVAPSASRSPAAPPTPSHPLAAGHGVTSSAPLSSRINSRSAADSVAGSLFDAKFARCRFHVSCVMCHVSCVMCLVSYVLCHMSCVMCQLAACFCLDNILMRALSDDALAVRVPLFSWYLLYLPLHAPTLCSHLHAATTAVVPSSAPARCHSSVDASVPKLGCNHQPLDTVARYSLSAPALQALSASTLQCARLQPMHP